MSLIFDQIRNEITTNNVVLYMKGTDKFPMCGFSSAVVQILKSLGVGFKAIDVLQDLELREGIKAFTNWPTIPQLYIQGEFIGGCDIVREMHQTGELQALFSEKDIPFNRNEKESVSQ